MSEPALTKSCPECGGVLRTALQKLGSAEVSMVAFCSNAAGKFCRLKALGVIGRGVDEAEAVQSFHAQAAKLRMGQRRPIPCAKHGGDAILIAGEGKDSGRQPKPPISQNLTQETMLL